MTTKKPTVADCLDEIRRLRAANERLTRLSQEQAPTREVLLEAAVTMRDLAFQYEMKANEFAEVKDRLYAAVGGNYLPRIEELSGIMSDGAQRVEAAMNESATKVDAVDPSDGNRES